MRRDAAIRTSLGFDDVLIKPLETNVKPSEVSLKTSLTKDIILNAPFISAGYGHVTESAMAIAMAQAGGIGIIHDNMPLGKQVEEVRRVKRAQTHVVQEPITISEAASLAEAIDLMTTYNVSGLPVSGEGQKVVGIITSRDVRFCEDYAKPISELMSREVVTVLEGAATDTIAAKKMMHENRIEKIVVLDEQGRCAGLITHSDIHKMEAHPNASLDSYGRLRVAAAVGLGKEALDRASAMADAGLDVVVVDVANAQSRDAIGTVSTIRQQRSTTIQVIAGNVASGEAAQRLIDSGADAIKVGIGGFECSASRHRLGVGVPQLAALIEVYEQCEVSGVPLLIDGLPLCAAMMAKALGAGASSIILGCPISGVAETPGRVAICEGKAYKTMSPAPMPGNDPYALGGGHGGGGAPYLGAVANVLDHLTHELKAALAYAGSADIPALQQTAEFVEVK